MKRFVVGSEFHITSELVRVLGHLQQTAVESQRLRAAGWPSDAPKTRQSHQWRAYAYDAHMHAAVWQPRLYTTAIIVARGFSDSVGSDSLLNAATSRNQKTTTPKLTVSALRTLCSIALATNYLCSCGKYLSVSWLTFTLAWLPCRSLLHFPSLRSPAFSTPCILVPNNPLPHFPPLHFSSYRIFHSRILNRPKQRLNSVW